MARTRHETDIEAKVKILFASHAFYPSIGGLEEASMLLAREFVLACHEIVVITQTCIDGEEQDFPFKIVRRPSASDLMRLTAWADVVFHNNISLGLAWPLLLIRRPWVVTHQTWLPRGRALSGAKGALKRAVLRGATGIAISRAISADFSTPCTVIPDPYDDEIFRSIPGVQRDRDLAFVGRFVSDKGLPILLKALVYLTERGLKPNLTVIGSGPEDQAWRRLTQELGLAKQVHFVGAKRGEQLATEFNRHRVLVVPSLWNEPFGIVALEGMACGCVVVGSSGGGLGDAIGPAGLTFPNGDASALADHLEGVLTDSDLLSRLRSSAPEHLAQHRPSEIAANYLAVISQALREYREGRRRVVRY
jgi:glycosyltransferase involved in cell wall biosynthesis